jgi:glucokinase
MKYSIGIDFGCTSIKGVLINRKGEIIAKIERKTEKITEQVLEIIKILKKTKISGKIEGVGIGIPGILDKKRDKIISIPNMKKFKNYYFKKFIEKKSKMKIKIENDSNCFALAELLFGEGRKIDNFVCLTIGTGIGGGIILNKKIYRGRGNASEFGHITVERDGRSCVCGNRGCLEEYVSKKGILKSAEELKLNYNIFEIKKKALEGDKKALEVVEKSGRYLGIGLSNIIKIIDPELIILGGGISNFGELLLNPARKEAKKRTLFDICKIKRTKLGKFSGALGAGSLIFLKK